MGLVVHSGIGFLMAWRKKKEYKRKKMHPLRLKTQPPNWTIWKLRHLKMIGILCQKPFGHEYTPSPSPRTRSRPKWCNPPKKSLKYRCYFPCFDLPSPLFRFPLVATCLVVSTSKAAVSTFQKPIPPCVNQGERPARQDTYNQALSRYDSLTKWRVEPLNQGEKTSFLASLKKRTL